jgi:hypothetical protein
MGTATKEDITSLMKGLVILQYSFGHSNQQVPSSGHSLFRDILCRGTYFMYWLAFYHGFIFRRH